jgi:hypothetical protein
VRNKNDAAFEVHGTTNDGDALLKSTPVTAPIAFAPVLAGAGIVTTKLIAAPLVPVERGGASGIIRDPERAASAEAIAPRIHQIRIRVISHVRQVGNQIVNQIVVLCCQMARK